VDVDSLPLLNDLMGRSDAEGVGPAAALVVRGHAQRFSGSRCPSAGPLLAMVYLCCAGIKTPLLSDRRPQVDPYRR
jgi:hypothetical protein